MPKLVHRLPRPFKHKATGQAVVKLSNKVFYLGPHGTKAAKAEYDRLVGLWISYGRCWPTTADDEPLSIAEAVVRYVAHVHDYYGPSREVSNVILALQALESHLDSYAAEFGPIKLKAVRQSLIDTGLCRSTINQRIHKVRRMFAWLVSEQLLPSSVNEALRTVEGLRAGRSKAKESDPVKPVEDAVVEATIPFLPAVVGDMVRLQMLTGARSGEICAMTPGAIDRTADVWVYRPESHKSKHRGRERNIHIGPKAQAILTPYLLRPAETCCFQPCESEKKRREQQHDARTTPLSCGNVPGSNRKRRPKRKPADCYNKDSYGNAVRRAIKRANEARLKDAAEAGIPADQVELVPHWHLHQIRHSTATKLRREFGIDAAAAQLGHSTAAVTLRYAELDAAKAANAMSKIG